MAIDKKHLEMIFGLQRMIKLMEENQKDIKRSFESVKNSAYFFKDATEALLEANTLLWEELKIQHSLKCKLLDLPEEQAEERWEILKQYIYKELEG
jgi:thermostable 8-oxoguanine DNA glycosylase